MRFTSCDVRDRIARTSNREAAFRCFLKSPRFFHQPLFKGRLVCDARSTDHDAVPPLLLLIPLKDSGSRLSGPDSPDEDGRLIHKRLITLAGHFLQSGSI